MMSWAQKGSATKLRLVQTLLSNWELPFCLRGGRTSSMCTW